MKALTVITTVSFLLLSGTACACGTSTPAVQGTVDAKDLAGLLGLAQVAAHEASEIFIGTVTGLDRPAPGATAFGSADFTVEETLKGEPSPARTVKWKERFVYSCQQSAMFHNVGFRPGGRFIVYVRGGEVVRSGAADSLRSGLLTLEKERAIAAGTGGG